LRDGSNENDSRSVMAKVKPLRPLIELFSMAGIASSNNYHWAVRAEAVFQWLIHDYMLRGYFRWNREKLLGTTACTWRALA